MHGPGAAEQHLHPVVPACHHSRACLNVELPARIAPTPQRPTPLQDIPVGSVLHPAKVQELKGAEATCVGISPTGNIVVVGCRAGELLVGLSPGPTLGVRV